MVAKVSIFRIGTTGAGVISLVQTAAQQLSGSNIRVNAISAGPVRTLAGSGIGDARATGLFFDAQTSEGIAKGIERFQSLDALMNATREELLSELYASVSRKRALGPGVVES